MPRYDGLKRAGDVVASAVLLLVLSPLLAVIALGVLVFLGRPVIFSQERPGLGGEPFCIYKFRTMALSRTESDVDAVATDVERLSPFGRFLRASSFDELPELWNVLRGDMSLIGPRPLLTAYLTRYNPTQARRHEVRPGLTGWAQVHGRNALDWERRLDMDVWYVDHRSLALDLKILVMTIATLFSRRGISSEGHATMSPFDPQATQKDREAQ